MSIRTICAALALAAAGNALADTTPHDLGTGNFSQNWSTTTLITADNNWSGVPSIIGYRGDDLTTGTGTDPQGILADGAATPVNVEANETNPNAFATGGVAEFDGIANPTIALNGSGTADAPHVVIRLNTTGRENIQAIYLLRDLDGSADNAVMPVALQYRVGATGAFTNVPAGFVADATTGPNLATQTTLVSALLPADADDQPIVDVRIITANAAGNDEWVGIDDLSIVSSPIPPTLAFDPVSADEGNAGNTTFTFAITKTSAAAATVQVATSDGTAIGGNPGPDIDFQEIPFNAGQLVSFPAGISTWNVSVTVFGDTEVEPDETFELVVFQPTNGIEGINEFARIPATIRNDDGLTPTVSIGDVSVIEGSGAGNMTAEFVVTISALPAADATVSFATAGDSATSGTDFTPTSGTLTFTPGGGLTRVVTVPITRDSIDEDDETFVVDLSSPVGLSIIDGQGLGTIQDDDTATLSVANLSQLEGTGGATNFTFTASLSTSASTPRTFVVSTSDGSAAAPGDYTAIMLPQNQTITFAPGITTQTFDVSVVGDALVEGDETFNVQLQPPQVQNPAATAVGTILNDDVSRELTINDASVIEGTGAGITNVVFTVGLSAAPAVGQDVTVNYATASGSALSGADFTATTGTLTFTSGGALTQTISVPVTRDNIDENDETFAITLSTPVNATIVDGSGVGTINDDDTSVLSIAGVSQPEGSSGTTTFTFTANLSVPSSSDRVFALTTTDGTATAPADYQAIAAGAQSVTFAAGAISQTFVVQVVGDTQPETDETFTVTLTPTNPAGAGVSATATIVNDDQPVVSIANAQVTEGTGSNATLSFTVSLSSPALAPVSVSFATSNGSATAPADYTAASGTVTFAAGQQTRPIAITVIGDALVEPDETLQVTLSAPVGATLGTAVATGTLVNDDNAALSVNDVALPEGNGGGTTPFVFTITSSTPSSTPISVNFATSPMSATSPDDFAVATGTATIAAGATTTTVAVNVVADSILENNEQFTVTLSAPMGATLADPTGLGTIINDDVPVAIPTLDRLGQVALLMALLGIGMGVLRQRD